MNAFSIFKKREELVALDIGSGALKMVEISGPSSQPKLEAFSIKIFDQEVTSNNLISKPEFVAECVAALCEANQVQDKRVVVTLPAPAVFTKRIRMPKQKDEELRSSVQFEAANFIPHKIDAVKLDYTVISESGKNQLDILVVAVKKELLETLEDCLALAGLEAAVADVDFFALHNIHELNYPELSSSTVATLSVGYRYTSLAISRKGVPLFVGDVSIGLRQLEEELVLKLGLSEATSRNAVQNLKFEADWQAVADAFVEQSAQELSRQLSFFWNTCGVEGKLDKVLIAGGGALLPGLSETLGRKSGYSTELLNPFKRVEIAEQIDKSYLSKVSPLLAVAGGLALRTPGDGLA